jgi:type IV pilus assembly protein PilY1
MRLSAAVLAVALAGLVPSGAWAQLVIQDNFTGPSSSYNWQSFNGACLTAGNGTGTIPACFGLPYYGTEALVGGANGVSGTTVTLPDPNGSGALRFTNGYPGGYRQNGAVVSNFTFPSNQGVQVTFSTVTYRGDSGGTGGNGADGISFFLMDGSKSPGIGAWGGSLGYSCSNTNPPYDGLVGAYLGLGIDEFGNFLNPGDNTASGPGYQWGRIGLRGAGNISWSWLNANYGSYYPSSMSSSQQQSAVQNTCKSGYVWDSSNSIATSTALLDYPAIPNAYKVLPSSFTIANESAMKRGDATVITYKLKVTQAGLLSFSYTYNGGAYQPVITNQSITASNGALPGTLRFGFAGSTGGSTNIHEIVCFQATPSNVSSSSAGLNEKQTAKVQTGTQVYFAYYFPNTWAGSLTSQNLVYDSTTGLVSIAATANWDASCVLSGVATGQTCAPTGGGPVSAQSSRTVLSWDGTQGIPFQWSNLTTAQKNALTAGDTAPINANRLNFLRGDRSNEINSAAAGLFRARTSVLGDIIDSSPTWVGPPSAPYPATWQDKIIASPSLPENSGQTYPTFVTNTKTRVNVIYSGANDGLLHGFRSGSYNSDGTYNNTTTPNDGTEVLAYMPGAVVQTIHSSSDPSVDFANNQYGHAFSVDAPPGTGELYYGGVWHTWLVGGLGPGGAAIYALDVTNPSTTNFSESNAASIVIGEWTPSTITCANVSSCGANLGNTYGVPQVRRFHNGKWGVVFGNGFGSTNGGSGIYVMTVDPTNAARTFYYLGTSGSTSGNGIAYVTPVDLDGDHIIDYVYAGDLSGKVWRFDLTSSDPMQWASSSSALFATPSGQPITTKVAVASAPAKTGPPRIMVDFGTGQQTPFTNTAAAQWASASQSLYGVWDWNVSGWNAKGSTQYASLTAPQTVSSSTLQTQTITNIDSSNRSVTNNPVCWKGSTQCTGGASANTQFGWVLSLPGSSGAGGGPEQVIYSPILAAGAFIVNTTIPASNSPLNCTNTSASGWTMAISPITGGAFKNSFFGDTSGNFVTVNNLVVSGLMLSGTGSPSLVTAGGSGTFGTGTYLVTQTVSGIGTVRKINPPGGSRGGRLTWIQRR